MNKRLQYLIPMGVAIALLCAALPLVGVQAAASAPAVQQDVTPEPTVEPAGQSSITEEELANMAYQSMLAPSGVVTLTDGSYEDAENRIFVGIGMTPTVAYGQIDGQDAAVVVIGESGGGSGSFESIALVLDVDGTPTNVATALLGDRVGVVDLNITDSGLIVVDMIAQGPNDPMCCPTMPVTRIYAYSYNQLAPVAEVAATIDGSPVTQQVLATIIPATAYDNTMPPGAQGQPKHPVWSLDNSDPQEVMNTRGAYVAIYSVAAYEKMWNDAGDNYVADSIAGLRKLLQDQPADLTQSPPILPEQPATNDIVAQVQYLDLADGGTGMRWVGRLTQSAEPVLAEGSLRYFFEGFSADGQRLIVAQAPITVPAATGIYTDAAMGADDYNALVAEWDKYIADVTASLNAMSGDETNPSLTALDAVMQSVTIQEMVNPLVPGVLTNLAYTSTLTEGPVQFVDGKYEDPELRINAAVAQTPPIAYGMLNGTWSAVVLIGENGGGSGVFTTMHVVQDVDGTPTPVAMTMLGDRVVIHSVSIGADQIVVDATTQGPNDPMCCPTLRVQQVYTLEGGELVAQEETPVAPAAGADATGAVTGTETITDSAAVTDTAEAAPAEGTDELAGTAWTWTKTQMNDDSVKTPAQADAFQLTFGTDGTLSSTTDCNTANGSYTVDGNQITIGPLATTRMACADGSQETEYLTDLGSVRSYLFADGNLVLELPFDSGGMIFAPAQ